MNMACQTGQIEMVLPSELGYELIAREIVASFARHVGFNRDRLDDLKTALCEACINAIEHGNQLDPQLHISIVCAYDGQQLCIDVCDEGIQTRTTQHKPLSIEEKVAGLGSLRGMGLLLMAQLADEASFIDEEQPGNCFRMVWYHQHPVSTPEQSPTS